MQQFKDDGGSQNRTIMEFRAPLGRDLSNVLGEQGDAFSHWGNRMQLRFRTYYNTLNINNPDGTSTTTSGIGDFDARFMTIAHVSSKWGVAPGVEAFFNTASNDAGGESALGALFTDREGNVVSLHRATNTNSM